MTGAWTVRDRSGQFLAGFVCDSHLDVARKVVSAHYDAFRLHVSSSYRELFDRALHQVLEREGWQIVRVKGRRRVSCVKNGDGQARAYKPEPAWTASPIGVVSSTGSALGQLGSA
jgi:hypothetical protein